jgi:hypothetical protein
MTIANQAIYDAVRACPLSTELNDDQTAVLASLMQLETYAAHQVVAQEGGTDNRLYVVVDGSLSVIKQVGGPEESLLVTLKVGDFAHELGFLDGAQRYASLVAGRRGPGAGAGAPGAGKLDPDPSDDPVPRDVRHRAHRAPHPDPLVGAGQRVDELHRQAARAVLNSWAAPKKTGPSRAPK